MCLAHVDGDFLAAAGDSQSATSQISSSQSEVSTSSQSQRSGCLASCPSGVLGRLLSVAGHVALRQLVLLESDLFNELKRRHALKETDAVADKKSEQEQKRKQNKRKSLAKVRANVTATC